MNVLISGSEGHLGNVLMPRLANDPSLTITGFDQQSSANHYAFIHGNMLDADADELMRGQDVFVHMAFVLMGGGLKAKRFDREHVREINVQGSQRLFDAAIRQGVKKIIFISSCAVYGAWPDNPVPMDESQPMRPQEGFSYAEDKVAVENYLMELEQQHPDVSIIRLRPHVILGKNAHVFLRTLLKQPFYAKLPDPQPLIQCVWENDVAKAIHQSIHSKACGAFNLASEPPMSFKNMQAIQRRWSIPIPAAFSKPLHGIAWKLTPLVGEPGWVDGLNHSLAVNTDKAKNELGWQAEKTTHECIASL